MIKRILFLSSWLLVARVYGFNIIEAEKQIFANEFKHLKITTPFYSTIDYRSGYSIYDMLFNVPILGITEDAPIDLSVFFGWMATTHNYSWAPSDNMAFTHRVPVGVMTKIPYVGFFAVGTYWMYTWQEVYKHLDNDKFLSYVDYPFTINTFRPIFKYDLDNKLLELRSMLSLKNWTSGLTKVGYFDLGALFKFKIKEMVKKAAKDYAKEKLEELKKEAKEAAEEAVERIEEEYKIRILYGLGGYYERNATTEFDVETNLPPNMHKIGLRNKIAWPIDEEEVQEASINFDIGTVFPGNLENKIDALAFKNLFFLLETRGLLDENLYLGAWYNREYGFGFGIGYGAFIMVGELLLAFRYNQGMLDPLYGRDGNTFSISLSVNIDLGDFLKKG